jgi:hypothetical protein
MMPSQSNPIIRFVPEFHSGSTQAEKEVELANRKAHAARWSHEKRKQKKEWDIKARSKFQVLGKFSSVPRLQILINRTIYSSLNQVKQRDHSEQGKCIALLRNCQWTQATSSKHHKAKEFL